MEHRRWSTERWWARLSFNWLLVYSESRAGESAALSAQLARCCVRLEVSVFQCPPVRAPISAGVQNKARRERGMKSTTMTSSQWPASNQIKNAAVVPLERICKHFARLPGDIAVRHWDAKAFHPGRPNPGCRKPKCGHRRRTPLKRRVQRRNRVWPAQTTGPLC